MISAVDSSILLDVVIGDPRHADSSEEALRRASREGQVIACSGLQLLDPSSRD